MFQQFEGLVVGKGITLADLKGTFEAMTRELFGDVSMRLRPSFFPYTEPSAEGDITCQSRCRAGAGPDAAPASRRAGSRFSAAAWSTRLSSKLSATTRNRSRASPLEWAWNAWRC